MNVVVYSAEPLIFRDGRPWGSGTPGRGGMLRWPLPSTLGGMLRTRIGFDRDPHYFDRSNGNHVENILQIKAIRLVRCLPVWKENNRVDDWSFLFPAPADALILNNEEKEQVVEDELLVHSYEYIDQTGHGGFDLPWKNWKIPVTDKRSKPAANRPAFWKQEYFFRWLETGKLKGIFNFDELGFDEPQVEMRMHSAIDPETGSVVDGALFSSQGIRLETVNRNGMITGKMGCALWLDGTDEGDSPTGFCKLGGESRTAFIEPLTVPFPECPEWFGRSRFLRLVLLTPGDFGSWAPGWLLPSVSLDETDWRTVPNTDIKVRLCSAFVNRWQPMSGWDYDAGGAKATRKLTPPGTVYVLELKQPDRAAELANILWGQSIDENLTNQDGFGCICVGNITIDDK